MIISVRGVKMDGLKEPPIIHALKDVLSRTVRVSWAGYIVEHHHDPRDALNQEGDDG